MKTAEVTLMTDIKPIETRYAGCRFRSRLEARWAVFFDHLGLRWEYEPEGYTLSTGDKYLPDFYLPALDQWVEVKGRLTPQNLKQIAIASVELPVALYPGQIRPGVLILGPVPEPSQPVGHTRMASLDGYALWQHVFFAPDRSILQIRNSVVLRVSALLTKADDELAAFLPLLTDATPEEYLSPMPSIRDAYRAARSARFEHGESG